MITGAHVIVYSKDPEADRAFFRDVLNFSNVDAGHGWLIFALPPAEAAFHPARKNNQHELYFMCDDLKAEVIGRGLSLPHFQHNAGSIDVGQNGQSAKTGNDLTQEFDPFAGNICLLE